MPIVLGERDLAFFQAKQIEIYKNYFAEVTVYKLTPQTFNSLYGEDSSKRYNESYKTNAYIPDLPGWKENLTKFGFDETRDLLIYFSLDLLKVTQTEERIPDIGDRVEIQGDMYTVVQTNPLDFGTNLQLPLSHQCKLERYRPETPKEMTTVYSDY